MKANIHNLLILSFGLIIFTSSCKKDPKITPEPDGPDPGVQASRSDLTKDSIFLYAKETYYWNEGMPSYNMFNPRSYDTNQEVLDAIIGLPGVDKPVDKYSFLDDGSVSEELGGVSGDYGFSVFYNGGQGTADLRIKYVSPNSPAADRGLKRGYRILKLNGRTDLNSSDDAVISFIGDAVFGSSASVSMTVQKPGGATEEVTVNRGTYLNNPIYHTQVYNVGGKKVGYIVYNSFTTNSGNALISEFAEFSAAGVTELVVDLRYNGGGSVSTADVFTNLIAPASVNGRVMYTTYWTKTMQEDRANILSYQPVLDNDGKLIPCTDCVNGSYATFADYNYRPTYEAGNVEKFAKIGSAAFNKVYFLVLPGTASASELLINNLKGVMNDNVKLIGRPTYGKPVGFFALRIDKLDLYIPQFETRNTRDEGGYYNGMTPDIDLADDVTKDFGDPDEQLLAAALEYAETGTFALKGPSNTLSSLRPMSAFQEKRLTQAFDKNEFKGMIEDKKLKFKNR